MNINTMLVVVLALFAVIAVVALLRFRTRVDIDVKGPGRTGLRVKGVNDLTAASGSAKIERASIVTAITSAPSTFPILASLPPLPDLFVGRDENLHDLKQRLGIHSSHKSPCPVQLLTTVRGLPGVGKTTVAAALAHDSQVTEAFPDGVLWISLGQKPSLISAFATWGRVIGTKDLLRSVTAKEAGLQLAAALRKKRMLLIVDDVWEIEHAEAFREVRGRDCALLITSREPRVVDGLATPAEVYKLPVLNPEDAFRLLRALAPSVVDANLEESRVLVESLGYLPLALHVAGRMLRIEAQRGWTVSQLLEELRKGTSLLKEKAPPDQIDLEKERIPTVGALFQKSTDRLDALTRHCFACLGVFAPKPATFDVAALQEVWQLVNPKPVADELMDRGLLEPVGAARFQIHTMLAAHARSLLAE